MSGSTLSLYLEETKTNEDSVFQSDMSLIQSQAKNIRTLDTSTGTRKAASGDKGDPCDALSPTALALHKVVKRSRLLLSGQTRLGRASPDLVLL